MSNSNLNFNLLKESFLKESDYSEDTKKYMRYILFNEDLVFKLEKKYNKDLCQFNLEEIKNVLGSFKSLSVDSVRKNRTVISKYIEYARLKNYISSNINFAQEITEDDLNNLIYKIAAEYKYITEEELEDICDICINYQDEVIFRSVHEGIKGERLIELIKLIEEDIDKQNNMIRINNGKNKRKIKVSNKTIKAIEAALEQTIYTSYGNTTAKEKNLVDTGYGYILKKTARSSENTIGYQTILQRFKKVRLEAGYPYLTIETLWWSGIFNQARQIKQEKGELKDQDYEYIMNKFGCNKEYAYKWKAINTINENI